MKTRYVLGRADEFANDQHYVVRGESRLTTNINKASKFESVADAIHFVRFEWPKNYDNLTLFYLEEQVIPTLIAVPLDKKEYSE